MLTGIVPVLEAWQSVLVGSNLERHLVVFIIGEIITLNFTNFFLTEIFLKLLHISLLFVFFYSEAEPKGSDCLEKFMDMQMCMKDYPDLYGNKDPMDVEEDEEEILNEKTEGKTIDKAEENR